MKEVKPRVFFVGESQAFHGENDPNDLHGGVDIGESDVEVGLGGYLKAIGAEEWDLENDAPSDPEFLSEVAGRVCYRSFAPGLNPNVTKVRDGNDTYLDHIIEIGHGSVLEHVWGNFIFLHVSRVLTHELVRHRIGVGISQESLRYVRLEDIPFWHPDADQSGLLTPEEQVEERAIMKAHVLNSEHTIRALTKLYRLEDTKDFGRKKKLTSRMRRMAPIGLATSMFWSCNLRTMRHVLEQRTAPGAEEEIRMVFGMVGKFAKKRWPNVFADYEIETVDGLPYFKTDHRKV